MTDTTKTTPKHPYHVPTPAKQIKTSGVRTLYPVLENHSLVEQDCPRITLYEQDNFLFFKIEDTIYVQGGSKQFAKEIVLYHRKKKDQEAQMAATGISLQLFAAQNEALESVTLKFYFVHEADTLALLEALYAHPFADTKTVRANNKAKALAGFATFASQQSAQMEPVGETNAMEEIKIELMEPQQLCLVGFEEEIEQKRFDANAIKAWIAHASRQVKKQGQALWEQVVHFVKKERKDEITIAFEQYQGVQTSLFDQAGSLMLALKQSYVEYYLENKVLRLYEVSDGTQYWLESRLVFFMQENSVVVSRSGESIARCDGKQVEVDVYYLHDFETLSESTITLDCEDEDEAHNFVEWMNAQHLRNHEEDILLLLSRFYHATPLELQLA